MSYLVQETTDRILLESGVGSLLLEEGGTDTAGIPAMMLLSDGTRYAIATSDTRTYAVGVADEARNDITVSDDPGV